MIKEKKREKTKSREPSAVSFFGCEFGISVTGEEYRKELVKNLDGLHGLMGTLFFLFFFFGRQ